MARIYLVMSCGSAPVSTDSGDATLTELVWPSAAGPWTRHAWKSRDGRACLQAWSNEPTDARLAEAIRSNDEAAVGCPGYFRDPRDIDRLLCADDVGAVADELSGVFGVFRVGQRGFQAVTTAVRIHPVYYSSVGDTHVAGNRAILVHAAARMAESGESSLAVRYNLRGMQSLVRSGYFLSDASPFEGVSVLPAHTTLEVAGGQRIVRRSLPPVTPGVPRGRAERSLVKQLADDLVAAVEPLRGFSEPVALALTGGRDSRLIAAALHAARVPFRASTGGFPDHPDVVLAARIAALLGVQHTSTPPRTDAQTGMLMVQHPLQRACEVIRFTEGMISAHNNVNRPASFIASARMSGSGGEQLRGGFLAGQRNAAAKAMRKRVDDLFLNWEDVFTDSANDCARREIAPWSALAMDDPMGALDRIYLYYRTGRWSAAARAASLVTHVAVDPFFDNRLNRSALAMSPEWRWSERPFHAAIKRLAPVLADVPLTSSRWRYELEPPGLRFRRRGWLARAPMPIDKAGTGFDWRDSLDPALIRVIREQILDGPAPLFEVVRRPRVEALLDTYPLNKASSFLLWNACTASVLLSGAWLTAPPNIPAVQIPLPSRSSG